MPKLPLFVQPPKPPGQPQYIAENDPRKQTSFLDPITDFVKGMGYFPTEPVPPDAGKAYKAGVATSSALPFLGTAMKGLTAAAPLITIFKDAQGVPSGALREASTQKFLDMARVLPHRMRAAAEQFAQDYPRVAAHMRPEYGLPPKQVPNAMAFVDTPPGRVEAPMKTGFTHIGRYHTETPTDYETGLNEARKMMYHEGTHAAQALGNADFNTLYNSANKLVGYDLNPFERTAERAANRAVGPVTRGHRTAIDMLKDITALPSGSPAADRIKSTLEVRENAPALREFSSFPSTPKPSIAVPAVDLSRLPSSIDYVQGLLKEHGLAPVASHETDPAMEALKQAFEGPLPEPSLQQHAATSRVTGRLMPKREMLDLPEGFEMPPGFRMGRREMPEEQKVWRAWTEAQKKLKYDPRETSPEAFPEVRQVEGAPVAKGVSELKDLAVTGQEAKEQAPLIGTWNRQAPGSRVRKEGRIPFGQLTPDHIKEIQKAAGSGLNVKQMTEKYPQYTKETIMKAVRMPWKD